MLKIGGDDTEMKVVMQNKKEMTIDDYYEVAKKILSKAIEKFKKQFNVEIIPIGSDYYEHFDTTSDPNNEFYYYSEPYRIHFPRGEYPIFNGDFDIVGWFVVELLTNGKIDRVFFHGMPTVVLHGKDYIFRYKELDEYECDMTWEYYPNIDKWEGIKLECI